MEKSPNPELGGAKPSDQRASHSSSSEEAPQNPPFYPTGYSNGTTTNAPSNVRSNGTANGQAHVLPTLKEDSAGYSHHDNFSRRSSSAVKTVTHQKLRTALGLDKEAPICEEHDEQEHSMLLWSRIRLILREPLAEFWGSFIYVAFGNAIVAQVLLSGPQGLSYTPTDGGQGFGGYQSINWGWALAVMLGIYVAGDSGAFLNPAITLAFCVYRGLPFRRWPIYLIAQFLGGYLAAGVVYAVYKPAIDAFAGVGVRTVPPATTATAGIFCTFPQPFLNSGQQFLNEFIATTILMFVIFALKDDTNRGAASGSSNWFPLSLFFLVFGVGAGFGFNTNYALNMVRDTAPRLMAYTVGYGPELWSSYNHYFWVPLVTPFIGCLFGGFLYDLSIYTGPESPVNTPYLGLPILLNPWKAYKNRQAERAAGHLPAEDQIHPM